MRLLFIRHAEPDYSTDTLTEKGRREAALLAQAAQETASYCMKAVGMNAKTLDWLEEFDAPVDLNRTPELLAAYPNVKPEPPAGTPVKPSTESEAKGFPRGDTPGKGEILTPGMYRLRRPWDIGQIYYAEHPELMDPFGWRSSEIYLKSEMPTRYDQVVNAFNELLASYFFCHLGVTCVLLSALWKTSPFFLWQNLAMPTSSVTELFTEEREPGAALFRARRIGDVSHLYAGNEPISFACRYCEVYSDFSEETGRH